MDDVTDSDQPSISMRQARLLDLRLYIAALFAIFGVIVTIAGVFASSADIAKAAGININLWGGMGMIGVSAVFFVWAMARPPIPHPESSPPDQ